MVKKFIFIIIGALAALLVFILAVMLGTASIGFQEVAIIELGLNIIAGFFLSRKFAEDLTIRSLSLGALYGSILYLVLIFLAKTVVYSLLGGIAA